MLISSAVVKEYRDTRDVVTNNLLTEFNGLVAEVASTSVEVQREALFEVLPTVAETHLQATSEVSAAFFTGLADLQEVPKLITPDVLEPSAPNFWRSLIGWGSSDRVLEQGGALLMFSLISGGLTRRLSMAAADTMVANAEIQTGNWHAQRVPQPGCCAFCGMLASRFGFYTEKSAGKVAGRGVPVGQGRGGGRIGSKGRGRGLKPRGAQAIGEDFHDFCRCEVVAITDDNYVQLQADAARYYEQYRESKDKIDDSLTRVSDDWMSSNGDRHSRYYSVDANDDEKTHKQQLSMVLADMRKNLNVR